MSASLQGAAAGASEVALPRIDEIGDSANVMVAYAIIWALKEAGVEVTSLQGLGRRHDQIVSNIDRYRMAHEFKKSRSLTLQFASPFTPEQCAATRFNLERFKKFAGSGWVMVDADQARQHKLRSELMWREICDPWAIKRGESVLPLPTLDDIPLQPFKLVKPLGDTNHMPHEILFHYLYEVATEQYPDKKEYPEIPDQRLFYLGAPNNSFCLMNMDNMQAPLDRAARLIGVPPMLLTRKSPDREQGI